MFYAIGARDGIWGLEGLDMTTGESRLRVETGSNPTHNSFYADTQIAPDGTVWTGTFGGVDILRPAEANAPLPLSCVDRRHTRCRGNEHDHASGDRPARSRPIADGDVLGTSLVLSFHSTAPARTWSGPSPDHQPGGRETLQAPHRRHLLPTLGAKGNSPFGLLRMDGGGWDEGSWWLLGTNDPVDPSYRHRATCWV